MERIGPYKVMEEIGRGGMGVVLHGVDPAIGRSVAIKIILLQEFSDPKDREMLRTRLFREAQAAGILSHPGIVTVYYVGEEGENAFIAMEYVKGPTLEKVLSASPPPSKELLRQVFWQTAAALDYAHGKGIIHRDIKPANIMLDESGAVKICDFGIAKGLAGQASLTQTGTSVGSPYYMSPEQIQGERLDYRTDQYSLGVVAYQALTGDRPFQAERIQSLFFRIMNDAPPLAHEVNPALSPAVSAVLQKVLAKNPADRYANCTDFVRALLEAWDAESAPPLPPRGAPVWAPPPATAPDRSSPREKLLIAGLSAAIVLVGLGIGAFYWTQVRTHQSAPATPAPKPPPKIGSVLPPQPGPSTPPPAGSITPPPAGSIAPPPAGSITPPPVGPTGPPAVSPRVAPTLTIERFAVEPATVPQGKPALLKWSVKNAAEVKIAPDIGVVSAVGARSVAPQAPTTYTLTAKTANGPLKTASVTLQVLAPPAVADFSASRTSIQSGQPAVLQWNVTGADEVSIDQNIGSVPAQGNQGVYPTVSTEYVLQAKGPGGSVSRSVTIRVTHEGDPKIVRFWADPAIIDVGESAYLRWEVANAAEVRIEPGVGRVDAQGRFKVSPQDTTTYRIFAVSKGTFHRDVQVKVKK